MLHALISLAHCPQAQKQLRALAHTLAQMLAQNTRSLRCLLKTLARSEHLLKTLVRSEHLLTRSLRCLLRTLARSDACSKHSLAQSTCSKHSFAQSTCSHARSDACSDHSLAAHQQNAGLRCSYVCSLPTPSKRLRPLTLPACAGCSMFLCVLASHS